VRTVLNESSGKDGSPFVCLFAENGIRAANVLPDIPCKEVQGIEMASLFGTKEENISFAPVSMLYEELSPGVRSLDLADGDAGGKKKTPLMATLVLAVLLVAMAVPYVVVPIAVEKRKIDAIEGQIKARRKDVMDVERLKKKTEALQGEMDEIEDFKKKTPMSLNVLKGLTSLLPKTAWLTRTRITEATVEIEGYAASATGLLSLLEESDLFRKVEFASPTIKDQRVNSERFVIRMELEGFKKQEKKEGVVKKDEAEK
jgi:Tfp pilus assembly protein PilN